MTNWQEVKSSVVSWGKVGDSVEGTLIDVVVREVRDDQKGLVRKNVYEIKADGGEYHEIDSQKNPVEPPIKCEPENSYLVWGGKDIIDGGMKKIRIGQKVRIVFAEQGEPKKKGYSGFKMIKIFTSGVMDQEWLDGREINAGDM